MSENERFQKRKNTVKLVWSVLFIISTIIFIVLIVLAVNDDEMVYFLPTYMFGVWELGCLIFWICALVGVKFHRYSYNGHEISLYLGFSSAYLLLDGIIVDKHTGSFMGARPLECDLDGEKVNLKIGYFTFNNYTLRVGNKVLH